MGSPTPIWSVGHSNHSLERFLDLLHAAEIEVLVDVRSQPFSRYTPHFNGPALEDAVTRAGISYLFMGDSLGGRPPEAHMYDAEGHVLYGEMAESERFQAGVKSLLGVAAKHRTAMMCSEESPIDCHRRLLIARVLDQGAEVIHLRADGSQIRDVDLRLLVDPPPPPTLFDLGEVKEWRSTRPVSRSTAREGSSEH